MSIASIAWDGNPISKPGIYSKMPIESYHKPDICIGPSVSSSGMRAFNPLSGKPNTPAHFWAHSPLNPKARMKSDAKHFVLGRALHHLILGEPFFATFFIERPDTVAGYTYNGNRTEWKQWFAEQRARGRTPLTQEQVGQIRGMAMSLWANPEVRKGLLNGAIERSMFWIDEETGLWCKARPDSIPANLQFGDLKITGTSVMWYDIQKSIENYGYYQQAALVAEGCRLLLSEQMQLFTYVFVESEFPHCVETVEIKTIDLERGYHVNHMALRKIAHGLKTGEWPGPGGIGIRPIEMVGRAQERVDRYIEFGDSND